MIRNHLRRQCARGSHGAIIAGWRTYSGLCVELNYPETSKKKKRGKEDDKDEEKESEDMHEILFGNRKN